MHIYNNTLLYIIYIIYITYNNVLYNINSSYKLIID